MSKWTGSEPKPAGAFSACFAEQDRSIVQFMKTAKATRHKAPRAKASKKMKMKAKGPALRAARMKKPARGVRQGVMKAKAKTATNVTPIRDRLDNRVFTDAREYDRRVFVRFDAPGKELVKAAAGESGLSPYIAYFATEAAKAGKKVVAAPATTREAGVFARFDSPTVKKMVAKAAIDCGVSLSAYAAYFALEAAKAGRTMPKKEAAAAAS